MVSPELISFSLVLTVTFLVVWPRFREPPGIGVLLGLIVVSVATWLGPGGLEQLGFAEPGSWAGTIVAAIAAGGAITVVTIAGLEPLIEHWTGEAHDWSLVEGVRESWSALLQLIVLVWVLVAALEEILFRGFLMLELRSLLGSSAPALGVNLLISSVVFGLAHAYQGRSGMVSTGVVGLFLGLLFVGSGYTLWLPVLTHGIVDTFSLFLMRLRWDERMRGRVRETMGWSAPGG